MNNYLEKSQPSSGLALEDSESEAGHNNRSKIERYARIALASSFLLASSESKASAPPDDANEEIRVLEKGMNQDTINEAVVLEEPPVCHAPAVYASKAETLDRQEGDDPRAKDSYTRDKLKELTECLDKNPSALNERDEDGAAPLHLAALFDGGMAIELLLGRGADSNIRDNEGLLPIDYANYRNSTHAIAALKRGGAKEVDWSKWRPVNKDTLVTDTRNLIRVMWAGPVIELRTTDGKLPKEDSSNLQYKIQVTWYTKDTRYECGQLLIFKAKKVKDVTRRSGEMRKCR